MKVEYKSDSQKEVVEIELIKSKNPYIMKKRLIVKLKKPLTVFLIRLYATYLSISIGILVITYILEWKEVGTWLVGALTILVLISVFFVLKDFFKLGKKNSIMYMFILTILSIGILVMVNYLMSFIPSR